LADDLDRFLDFPVWRFLGQIVPIRLQYQRTRSARVLAWAGETASLLMNCTGERASARVNWRLENLISPEEALAITGYGLRPLPKARKYRAG
jgi:hypothetical protein